MAYYAGAAVQGYLQLKFNVTQLSSDGRIDANEVKALRLDLDGSKTHAWSQRGYKEYEWYDLASAPKHQTQWTVSGSERAFVHRRFLGQEVDLANNSVEDYLGMWGFSRDLPTTSGEWVAPKVPKK
jgi:hypothetical protein